MIHSVTKLFAEYGGLIGLVVLALLVMVAYLINKVTRIAERLLVAVEDNARSVQENDERLIDLKKALWTAESLPLPDRRKEERK